MAQKKIILIANLILFFISFSFSYSQGNLPKSREAVFVDAYSPTEVIVKAKGIGKDVNAAENDAKKAAVYFLLYNATDPVLQTQAEKQAFANIENDFFDIANINNYIAYMANDILSRVKVGKEIKIEKMIRVNRQKLNDDLAAKGIVASKEALAAAVGNPFIMVIPEVKKGENPINILQSNPNVKKGAEVIEGYLTARKYEVQVPEALDQLNDLVSAQVGIKGIEDDPAYAIALSIGSDVYITYNVAVEQGSIGKKAVVAARAYETTTARLLGTETGYSPERPNAPDAALIEEAMNWAIEKVLSRINAYWKEDINNGQQYKVIFKITGSFEDPYEVADIVDDVLKDVTTKKKQNIATEQTIDYNIWQNKFENSNRFFRELNKKLEANNDFKSLGAKLKRINVNRKLIIIGIENAN
jgi:acetyltransferase-like isoleucine patch superfamily enzyme